MKPLGSFCFLNDYNYHNQRVELWKNTSRIKKTYQQTKPVRAKLTMDSKQIIIIVLAFLIIVSCSNQNLATVANTPISEPTSEKVTPSQNEISTLLPLTPNTFESQILVKKLLEDNADCQLPCWHGITPGVSTIIDLDVVVRMLLGMPLSQKTGSFLGQEYIATNAYREISIDGTIIYISVGSFSQLNRNNLDVLQVWSNVIGYQESDESKGYSTYWREFENYSLQNVLLIYGVPEEILIFSEMYHEDFLQDRESLHIHILYPSRGIYVSYDMPSTRDNDRGVFCPIDANFNLWLTSSDSNEFYKLWWQNSQGYTNFSETFDMSIEEALGMDIESFYEVFSKENTSCFITPIKIWLP